MSTATTTNTATRGDSLLAGVAFMLVLNVVQRGIGFARGLLFCRFLAADELGQFSLATSFLQMAAPLIVLGLPGSFGRYVEYYRQRGQLRSFLHRLTKVTLVLTGGGILLLSLGESWLAEAMLGDRTATRLMSLSLATLAIVVVFNYLNELLTALRQVRAVSWMQFVNSIAFTVIGLLLVVVWEPTAFAVIAAFGISGVAGIAALAPWYRELWSEFRADNERVESRDLWFKLLPFAGWMWLTNLLANAADMVDRLMIMHWSGLDAHIAQELVGQYHSARVVPLLLATMSVTIASIVLPHWSHAWEAGKRQDVSKQTNLSLKLISVTFAAGSLAVLWLSPLLFGVILGGKYDEGLAALPWALVGCIWFSLYVMAQNYLWCAEQAKLGTLALFVGAVANLLLNLIAIPLGLPAIMAARGIATLGSTLLVLWFNAREGMQFSRGLVIACVVPLVVLLGPELGTTLLLAIIVLDWRMHWLFDAAEEPQLHEVGLKVARKLKLIP